MTYIDINKFMGKISRGDVFLMHGNIKTEQMHYQVVLNNKINENDNIIYLSISTTKIENRKKFIETRGFSPETLVMVYVGEVSFYQKILVLIVIIFQLIQNLIFLVIMN
ncbi:hypothetical protein DLH72_03900 [Candidatus Gracilibacteria bacterium]|nr:MAG: hypothetical protein DLH72_03900 [Candidatus Gracilibacteria bacterium]